MFKIRSFFLVLTVLFVPLFISFNSNAQGFPQGLIGLSTANPGGLYTINPNTGAATPFATTDGLASIVGLSYIEGTLYGSDLEDYPDTEVPDEFTVGSIAPNGVISFISDQNESSNWWGLASDDCGENILYSTDSNNENILTVQFTNGNVQTIGQGSDIGFGGMAYDDENEILYGLNDDNMDLYTISTTTGVRTLIGPTGIPNASFDSGLAYDEANKILYANHVNKLGAVPDNYNRL